eukprot:795246-Rhodomonas_salina.2
MLLTRWYYPTSALVLRLVPPSSSHTGTTLHHAGTNRFSSLLPAVPSSPRPSDRSPSLEKGESLVWRKRQLALANAASQQALPHVLTEASDQSTTSIPSASSLRGGRNGSRSPGPAGAGVRAMGGSVRAMGG